MMSHVIQKGQLWLAVWATLLLIVGCGPQEGYEAEASQTPQPEEEIIQSAVSAPRPDLNGLRLGHPVTGAIYLIDEGYRRHIPNPETYNNLFRDWNDIIWDPYVNDIPELAPLSHGSILAQTNGTAPIYLISNGVKRWISSPYIMDRYYFNWGKVVVLNQPILLNSIPSGASIY
jgi:hypothetical protein